MATIRKVALRLLSAMVQHSSGESRSWGNAMLREMDFVENDWGALWWALGSTTALCRHVVSHQVRIRFDRNSLEALSVKRMAGRLAAMLAGIAAASTVLIICILALSSLIHASWFVPTHGRLAERLLVVVVPETVYVIGAAALWRHRKSVALGIVAAGVILITHAAIHFVTHA